METTEQGRRLRQLLANIIGTPGYISLLLGWLLFLGSLFYLMGRFSGLTPSQAPRNEQNTSIVLVDGANMLTNSAILLVGLIIWYFIADGVRSAIGKIILRFADPARTKLLVTYGALSLGWILSLATLILVNGFNGFTLFGLSIFIVGLVSFAFEDLLTRAWHLE